MTIRPKLMVITDTTVVEMATMLERLEALAARAVPGSLVVQVRDRQLSTASRLELARGIADTCRRRSQHFVVNDRCDVAFVVGADGVHLGEESMTATDARSLLGTNAWISVARHRPEDVAVDAADAVVLSPVVEARKGLPALGTAALGGARRALDRTASSGGRSPRLYALGGVDAESAPECVAAGADGVAAIGAALAADARHLLVSLGIAR